jgi:hypothetical protein
MSIDLLLIITVLHMHKIAGSMKKVPKINLSAFSWINGSTL